MSNLYINTLQVVGGILTPFAVIILLTMVVQALRLRTALIEKKTEELRQKPNFKVRLHEVPNSKMWGVEISKNGEVLEDVGVDKI